MTYYAINGSPRKTHNTATILNKALEGVKAADPQAQTELIHLYSHDFSGCVSCFECKRLGGKSYGKCAVRDGLTPILERLADADGIIFGSPVYFHSITGKMRMFFERLLFQYFVYDADYSALSPKRMPTAFVYTMNVPYQVMLESHYTESFQSMELFALPQLMPFTPEFNLGAIVSVTLIFLVSATETIGDTSALTMVGLNREVKEKELSGSIACDGFVSSLSACFGCLPITSFSQNVGLVAMTKVVNRKAIATGAVIMILAAFLPVISVIFASLPEAVLGGCTIMMFGNIIVSGFQMIARAGFSQRNILIAALSLAVGIGFTQVSALFASFPELIQSVFAQNCVAVVFLVAVVANLVLPKDAGIEGATAMSERSTAEAAPSVDEDGDLATA